MLPNRRRVERNFRRTLDLMQLFRASSTLKTISIRGEFDGKMSSQLMFEDTPRKLTNGDKFRLKMVLHPKKHAKDVPNRVLIREKIR